MDHFFATFASDICCLICYCSCAETAIRLLPVKKIRPQIWLLRAWFPIWQEILEIGPRFHVVLANSLLRMRRNGQNSTSSEIFNPKFEIPMGCFLFEYEFWCGFSRDLYVFWAKNGFCNAKFSEFGGYWWWGDHFWRNPQKARPWLISRVLSHYACKSVQEFFL